MSEIETFVAGPLPVSIADDEIAWRAAWEAELRVQGGEPMGEPSIVERREMVGHTDADGVWHEPIEACFVSGPARRVTR